MALFLIAIKKRFLKIKKNLPIILAHIKIFLPNGAQN
jgi:hypothetical protein